MAEYTGTFETGSDGNTIQVADAGSATAWNDRSFTADSTLKYSSTQAYDTLSAQMVFSATPDSCYVSWTSATFGSLTELWGRTYFYYTNLPSVQSTCIRGFESGSRAWEIIIDSTGKVIVRDAGGTARGTGAVAINSPGWARIEFHVQNSSTVGFIEAKLFNNPDSATQTETITSSGSFSTGTITDEIRFGEMGGFNASNTVYMDNILINDTGYPGPAGGTTVNGSATTEFTFNTNAIGSVPGRGQGTSAYVRRSRHRGSDTYGKGYFGRGGGRR